MKKTRRIAAMFCAVIFLHGSAFAGNMSPGGLSVSSSLDEYKRELKNESMEKRLAKSNVKRPKINARELLALPAGESDIYIISIIVQSNGSVSDKMRSEIVKMTVENERNNLSLAEMKKIASVLTERYGAQGFKAYVPEQSFEENTLYINLISR